MSITNNGNSDGSGGDVLRIRVMDWITDTSTEQQTTVELFQSLIPTTRHLEIRLTGWTINQNSRLHIGINTVPIILNTLLQMQTMQTRTSGSSSSSSSSSIEELTIDLECLSRASTLNTFCNLIASTTSASASASGSVIGNSQSGGGCCYSSARVGLQKITITCSGEEDMSKFSLRVLGMAFQRLKKQQNDKKNNKSGTTLKFYGTNPDHLSIILYNMQRKKKSCCFLPLGCLDKEGCCCCSSTCCCCPHPNKTNSNSSSTEYHQYQHQQQKPCPRVLPQQSYDPYEAVPNDDDDDDDDEDGHDDDEDNGTPTQEGCGYPKSLELEQINLSHSTISNLSYLLAWISPDRTKNRKNKSSTNSPETTISNLTLCDCDIVRDDLDFLTYLLGGNSVLQELTLERLRIRTFHDHHAAAGAQVLPAWWTNTTTNLCSRRRSIPKTSTTSTQRGLKTVRLIDCRGSRKEDLEAVTDALIISSDNNDDTLRKLELQYSSTETSSMTIHALNALYTKSVVQNRCLRSLRELQVSCAGGGGVQSYRLQQLATYLGHPLCYLERLILDFGSAAAASPHGGGGPPSGTTTLLPCYRLDVLGEKLIHNNHLRYLSLSGDDVLDLRTLSCFVDALQDVPNVKTLELDFPGSMMRPTNHRVLQIFQSNTTLENVRIINANPNNNHNDNDDMDGDSEGENDDEDDSTHLSYLGLRNRLHNLLLMLSKERVGWKVGTWKKVLQVLLRWREDQTNNHNNLNQTSEFPPSDCNRELVMTSALWFAFMECPLMVSELGPLYLFEKDSEQGGGGR